MAVTMSNSSQALTIHDYWEIVCRRKWLVLGVLLASLIVSGVLLVVIPKSYKSSSLILVEDQKIPEAYVKGVSGRMEERLIAIQQQIMSRTILSRVIEEYHLYQDDIRSDGLDEVIERMRKKIKVQTVSTTGIQGPNIAAFTLSFSHYNPVTAMKVTSALASRFIEENLKIREQLVEGASEFLDQELRRTKQLLQDQEQAITDFKSKYMGELPQQTEANLRALDRLQSEMNLNAVEVRGLSDRLALIEKTISEYRLSGQMAPDALLGQGPKLGVDPRVLQLQELERELRKLSAEYRDTYPDIVRTKNEIERLKSQLAEGPPADADDEKEQGKTAVFDPYLNSLLKQRNETKVGLTAAREREHRLTGQMKEYEKRVEHSPAREQELMVLVRDYENLQKNYQSLLEKKLEARVVESLEKRQKGEQFRIIDPANLPKKPEWPDPLIVMLIGLVGGSGLGVGSAIGMEQLRPVFRRADEVEGVLELPVIAEIPAMKFAYRARTGRLLTGRVASPGAALPALAAPTARSSFDSNGGQRPRKEWRSVLRRWSQSYSSNGHSRYRYSKSHADSERDVPRQFALIAKWSPTSVVAEQFRVAVTKLVLMFSDIPCPVVEITSAVKGEGKSATAANLAYTLARDLAKRTLLIDCDFKSPTLHEYLEVSCEPGLTDMMNNGHALGDCLVPIPGVPLWVLPGGNSQSRMVELSKAPELHTLIASLRSQYDYIVLDAPPILPLADMNVLSGLADGLLMVIRAGSTPRRVVQNAIHRLRATNQLALILNDIDAAVMPYYMRYEYRSQPPIGVLSS
jgi:succinoglycan biosynthesis transport protein ExoP